ncbi:MAG: ROK family protein [Pseudomonadota bacterium]|nr:ROK family protein [Pseudomonadota bacterium]
MNPVVAAVELGGTRASVTAGEAPDRCAEPILLPTTTPVETLERLGDSLEALRRDGRIFDRIGVASFGPLGVDPQRPGWGRIGPTPKAGWSGVDVAGVLQTRLGVPVIIDTDVNGAAMGEGRWGAARGCRSHAYVTIGTGVGVGVVVDSRPVHGLAHPEAGHLRPRRLRDDDFAGHCAWHGDCLEGLISGPALRERLGAPADELSDDHPVFDLVGAYLGEALAMVTLVVSPERIVVGGGVGRRPAVLAAARHALAASLNGYVAQMAEQAEEFLAPPMLGSHSGLFGAMALALAARGGLQSFA